MEPSALRIPLGSSTHWLHQHDGLRLLFSFLQLRPTSVGLFCLSKTITISQRCNMNGMMFLRLNMTCCDEK